MNGDAPLRRLPRCWGRIVVRRPRPRWIVDLGQTPYVVVAAERGPRGAIRLTWQKTEVAPRELVVAGGDGRTSISSSRRVTRRPRARPCLAVLSPSDAWIKTVRVPLLGGLERSRLFTFEAEQLFPLPLHELCWTVQVNQENEQDVEAVFVGCERRRVEAWCDELKTAGFEVEAFVPTPIAWAAARAAQAPAGPAEVLIAPGARETSLVYRTGRRFWYRSASGRVEPHRDGESDRVVPCKDRAFLEQLETERARIELALRRDGVPPPEREIWIDEGDLNGSTPDTVASGSVEFSASDESALRQPTLLGCFGVLELAGAEHPFDKLVPLSVRRERQRRSMMRHRCAATIVATLGLGLVAGAHVAAIRTVREEVSEIEARLARARPLAAEVASLQQHYAQLQQRQTQLGQLQRERTRWVALLRELQLWIEPEQPAWLERLQVLDPPAAPRGATDRLRASWSPPPATSAESSPAHSEIRVTGLLLDGLVPAENERPDLRVRAHRLLSRIADSPLVAQVISERFDPVEAGVLRFELILRLTSPNPPTSA